MQLDSITIVGVGLLGGSIGLAVRSRQLARRVVGVGRDPERLAVAREYGAIDGHTTSLAEGVRDAQLVIFCTPVDRIAGQVIEASTHCTPETILTDVGSTKSNIVTAVQGRLPRSVYFVGSHPMAGSEKTGVEHARAELFIDRTTIITPTLTSPQYAVSTLESFWSALGSQVVRMSPQEHDRAVAVTSHVPHALASALAANLPADLYPLTGMGFRDTTRIAAGDAELWTAIFQANRAAVLTGLRRFTDYLHQLTELIEHDQGPELKKFLASAKKVRDDLGN